ncbi:MAG: hypothetical protein H0U40_06805 [Chloroflexia bacterium]|nr:hypothetical protein [Chloroflexia bacterium]
MTRHGGPRTTRASAWPLTASRAYLVAGRLALAIVSAPALTLSALREPVPISRTAQHLRPGHRRGFDPAELAGPYVITLPHSPVTTRPALDGGARPPGAERLPPRSGPRRG